MSLAAGRPVEGDHTQRTIISTLLHGNGGATQSNQPPQHQTLHHQATMSAIHHVPQAYAPMTTPRTFTHHTHSTFTTPAGSAASSPYLSPSLSSNASTASGASTLALGQTSLEHMIRIGSRVQVRGPEHVHEKLHQYAHTQADIVQLPAHPNTWYGVRLRDGKLVKLRKSAFEVIAIYPPGSSTTSSPSMHPQQPYTPFTQQTPTSHPLYSPFQFTQFQSPHQQPGVHFSPYTPPQQQYHQQPATKLVYASPSPSPSPVPTNVPAAMAGLTVSTPQSSPQKSAPLDPQASEEEYEELDLDAAPTNKHRQQQQQRASASTSHASPASEDENDEDMSDAGSSSRVRHSKRKPVPRAMSPEAEVDGDESDRSADDEDQDQEDDEDEDDEESFPKKSKKHKASSASNKTANAPGSGSKAARQRRGRGRALLGLNVVITNGRYKGETGLVVRGANGYYSCKFHRPIAELRAHDNTAMKRSSELAPITPSGKRLTLPIPPAQRKLMKQQALQATNLGALPISASNSPRVRATAAPAAAGASGEKRKAASYSAASPRGDRRKVQRKGASSSGEGTDEEQYDDERSPRDEVMYSSGDDYENAPRLSHSRSHSSSSSRSSSPSRSSVTGDSEGSQSPTHTELLSPHSHPATPTHYALTPLQTSSSIPASPAHLHHHTHDGKYLPSLTLPPIGHSGSGGASKSASMRSQSPSVKQAACLLMALSKEGLVGSPLSDNGGNEIPVHHAPEQLTYSLTHIAKQEVRPEQWMSGAGAHFKAMVPPSVFGRTTLQQDPRAQWHVAH